MLTSSISWTKKSGNRIPINPFHVVSTPLTVLLRYRKKYTDINNIIVRISDGTNATKNNALLVNAHTDSTLPSPGAADDIAGVSVMLEILRVLAETPRPLTNSVVFRELYFELPSPAHALRRYSTVFNSAEESLQDASHLFITQHELAKTIQAVINLEACGNTGPSMAFQATSTEVSIDHRLLERVLTPSFR